MQLALKVTSTLFVLLGAGIASASSVSVNGTCSVGTCTSSDFLAVGASSSNPFNFIYTFANTDRYQASGMILATDTSSAISITAASITLTYLGNGQGTSAAADVLAIDLLQYFSVGGTGSNTSGSEYITGNFSGAYSNASSVTGQAFFGSSSAAVLGPFLPPAAFTASASNQPFSFSPVTRVDFRDTVTFGAGSGVGATINISNVPTNASPAPEPATWLLLSTGLLVLFAQEILNKPLRLLRKH